MIEAMIADETNPAKLAALAHRSMKASQSQLCAPLCGRVTTQHRFLLRLHLRQIDALDFDQQVADIESFRAAVQQLSSIPGVKGAKVIVSEIGIDMSRFPSDGHLISWAGICPRNDESAGKRRSNRLCKVAPRLKTTLVQCAWSAVRQKDTYLRSQFYHIRRGAARRRRSWPPLARSSPPSTTC
jgi:transposase